MARGALDETSSPAVGFHLTTRCSSLRHGAKILAHMFRGVTLKTLFGLENERKAFERYRAIRQAERIYAWTRRVILLYVICFIALRRL